MDEDYYGDYDEQAAMEELMEYINSGGQMTPEIMEYLNARQQGPVKQPERVLVTELLENCIVPSSSQVFHMLMPLFILCVIFRFVCQLNSIAPASKNSQFIHWFIHASSAAFGLMMLNTFFRGILVYPLLCCVLCYLLLYLVYRSGRQYCGLVTAGFILITSISCELYLVEPKSWHKIRGAQIILSMKVISLASDVAAGKIATLPNIVEYLGYCLNVGTVIFGPWISYEDYTKVLSDEQNLISLKWVCQVLAKVLIAGICLLYSNCGTHWIILDGLWRWLVAYRDAQSFRFSHYFVSFVSDTTLTITGLVKQDSEWSGSVARPQNIELPRSLVEVVTNWNLPMHTWLKNYVFKPLRPNGAFLAVIVTYVASSLLHGLNFQLSAVLLSLGFYSYTEFVFRRRLSQIFDACIQAKRCKEKCDHIYQWKHPMVLLFNLAFTVLAIYHLAYLGLMFDSSDEQDKGYTMWHTLDKWASLDYQSHLVAGSMFLFYWLI